MLRFIFWSSWTIAVLVTGIFLYFFILGVGDRTVSSFNIAVWITVLAGLFSVTGGSLWLWLKKAKQPVLAIIATVLVAVPALLAGALFLLLSLSSWH